MDIIETGGLISRKRIGNVVRALRRGRARTQAELAKKLRTSQARLSQIESGGGSFSAEQLLHILKLFNITPATFADDSSDRRAQLQNALARLGAHHLQENGQILPGTGADDVITTVVEALSVGESRLTTALAPVLVENIDRVPLSKLHLELSRAGFDRRLPWLCENVVRAIDSGLKAALPRVWANAARRTDLVMTLFLDAAAPPTGQPAWDVLDTGIRSKKTADDVQRTASDLSKKWRILSSLKPEDFAGALRAAHA
jgi:transcriptional regulator with XRE-family HTH domain